MNNLIATWLKQYPGQTTEDYLQVLHEIFQEIALLGLWRSKFFEHAAFYGGTALRILYGLDRFSEDLDFSLLKHSKNFDLESYNQAIKAELRAFGFEVEVKTKEKQTSIKSAFIKANTRQQLISIEAPKNFITALPRDYLITIKMEIDTDPPLDFETESRYLFKPIPFSILTFNQSSLFAGKLHAILCRQWKTRVKGRDFYDFLWYLKQNIQPDLKHLSARLIQSGHLTPGKLLDKKHLQELLLARLDTLDIDQAKKDVRPFLQNPEVLEAWSIDLFKAAVLKLCHVRADT